MSKHWLKALVALSILLTWHFASAQVETDFSAGGGVKIGDSATVCDGTIAGALRYNDAGSDTLDYCNGVSWLTVLTNAVTGIVDGGNATGAAITIGTNDNFALNFETNATTRMTIDNAGNVGIGTTTPSDPLHLYTSGTNYAILKMEAAGTGRSNLVMESGNAPRLSMQDNSAAFDEKAFRLTSESGIFSIRTQNDANNNAISAFEVRRSGVNPTEVHFPNVNTWQYKDASVQSWLASYTTSGTPQYSFLRGRGTRSSPAAVQDGDSLGLIRYRGFYNGSNNASAAYLEGFADGAPTGTGVPGRLSFSTSDGTTMTERMTIKSDGLIGIGTSTPTVELDVNTGTINAAQVCDENNANCLDLSAGVSGGDPSYGSSASSPNDAVYVDDSGEVGIGTTNAARLLEVKGTDEVARFTGTNTNPPLAEFQNNDGTQFKIGVDTNHDATFRTWAEPYHFATSLDGTQEVFTILANGNVGVGNTNPAEKLQVQSASGDSKLVIQADPTNTVEGDNPFLVFQHDGGESVGGIFLSDDGSNPARNALNISQSNTDGQGINFRTGSVDNAFETAAIRMKIMGNGNVGIGTTTPAFNTHIHDPSSGIGAEVALALSTGDTGTTATDGLHLGLYNDGATTFGYLTNHEDTDFRYVGGSTTRMFIEGLTGFIGIGTDAPAVELDVNTGTINAASICDENNANCLDLSAGVGGGGSGDILNGGNTEGAAVTIGTNDNFGLNLETNGITRMSVGTDGNIDLTNAIRVANGGATSPTYSFSSATNLGFYNSGSDVGLVSGSAQWFFGSNSIRSAYSNGPRMHGGLSLTETKPAFSFNGDENTGMFRPGADSLALSTGGTERLRLDSSGNVGIGTTAPSKKLHVDGGDIEFSGNAVDLDMNVTGTPGGADWAAMHFRRNGTLMSAITALPTANNYEDLEIWIDADNNATGQFAIKSGATPNYDFVVLPNGNVGIGTTTPAVDLDVDTGTINAASICDENNANCLDLSAGGGSGSALLDGGNAKGAAVVAGTNDAQDFQIESNGSTRVTFESGGDVKFGGSSLYGGGVKYQFVSNPWSEASDFAQVNNDAYFNGSAANTGTVTAVRNWSRVNKSAGFDMNSVYGAHNITTHYSAGAMTLGVGSYNEVGQISTAGGTDKVGTYSRVNVTGGTLTNAYGFRAQIDNTSTITNAYGLYVNDLPATNNWGVYQAGADDSNYFAGNIGIGTTTPTDKVHTYLDGTGGTFQTWTADLGTNVRSAYLRAPSADSQTSPFVLDTPNAWAFRTDNIDRLNIAANGRVGVGTDSPAGTFEVAGNFVVSTADDTMMTQVGLRRNSNSGMELDALQGFYFNMDTNNNDTNSIFNVSVDAKSTNLFTILSSGNVGIGTNSPADMLHIESATGSAIMLTNTGDNDPQIHINGNRTAASTLLGQVDYQWNGTSVAQLRATTGSDNTNKDEGYLEFLTRDTGDTNPVTRLEIRQSGTVRPGADNTYDFGSSTRRWAEIFAANATINTSDRRLKEDIQPIQEDLDFILGLKPVNYRWIDGKNKKQFNGFIAQDVEELLGGQDKAMIHYDEESDRYGLRYTQFVAPLVKSVQQLYGMCMATDEDLRQISLLSQQNKRDIASVKENDDLQDRRIEELEKENQQLKSELEAIKSLLKKNGIR